MWAKVSSVNGLKPIRSKSDYFHFKDYYLWHVYFSNLVFTFRSTNDRTWMLSFLNFNFLQSNIFHCRQVRNKFNKIDNNHKRTRGITANSGPLQDTWTQAKALLMIAYGELCWIRDLWRRFSFETRDQAWSLKSLCVAEFY